MFGMMKYMRQVARIPIDISSSRKDGSVRIFKSATTEPLNIYHRVSLSIRDAEHSERRSEVS